ncbi:putative F-box domain-containing protein [Medicago truncatula]|uniref:Putative F-box domain-containing protein n=1 Tax=Medicago truncatula TaxID=3880 RepID=A0A396GZC7_MEDTR|nr:putative F-box domain-containing protein [Medicago truncatula]
MPNADRISALPEQVLCHIIELLPMKQIFATSLLSKRWRPLRRRIDNINLDDRTYMDDFDAWHYYRMGLVFLFNIQIPIKCFNLVYASPFCRSSKLDTFLHLLVNRDVEHVNLTFLQQPSIVCLPYKILTCTTLVVLKLNGLTIDYVHFLKIYSKKIYKLATLLLLLMMLQSS